VVARRTAANIFLWPIVLVTIRVLAYEACAIGTQA